MLYRLHPPTNVTWCAVPARTTLDLVALHPGSDLDRLHWELAESRAFSADLLRIALRHGVATATGIVLDAGYTVDLGRADELRVGQQAIDEAQSAVRDGSADALMEQLLPGWSASGQELDGRVRESTENAIREAQDDLAKVLGAPERPGLVKHWTTPGGQLPS